MPALVTRLLGIERGEGRVFAWAGATFFLVHAASVVLANAADTLFLKRIGVRLLPVAFLVSSLLLVVTTAAVVRLATRRPPIPLLGRTLFALAAMLLPLWLLAVADVRSVFALLIVISKQVESVALLVFWVAIGGLLHARQAKRLYAPIVAGGTLGEIAGSFASAAIARGFGIAALLPVAATVLALAGLLARRAAALAAVRLERRGRVRRARPGSGSALAAFVPLWRESRLFRVLALSALLCGVLGPMLYFQFSFVADRATQGGDAEMRLLRLYANFRGWLNVAVLALQLLGTARLFRRIGIPLAATLSPVIYLLGFLGMSVRLGLATAIAATAGATLQDHAVYDPAQRVLVTLFPERQRPAATSLIDGPIQRVGGVLGNLLVILTLAVAAPASVAVAGLPIAGLWAAVALVLWRIYPTLLLEVATARRLRAEEAPLTELIDAATQRALSTTLIDPDPQRVRAACALVAEGPVGPAVAALAGAAALAPSELRPPLLEALHRVLDRGDGTPIEAASAAQDLEAVIQEAPPADAVERASLVGAYARLVPDVRPGSHASTVLARLLTDPAASVRLTATARLHAAGALDPPCNDFDAVLAAACASDDPAVRHVALDELRALLLTMSPNGDGDAAADAQRRAARLAVLADRLLDPRDRVRAAQVLADLAQRHGPALASQADALLPFARDPDARVRAAVLRFVGHARLEGEVGWAVERLESEDDAEAEAAAAALRALGPAAINALLDALHRGRRAARRAVLPILRDLHIAVSTLRGLIDREVGVIQRLQLQVYALAPGVSELVIQRLRERVDETAQSVLVLLATLLDEDRLAALGRLLSRSPRGRARAVLLEAVEALLPAKERARLIPLLDDVDSRAAAAAAEALARPLPSFEEALRDVRSDQDPLTIAFLDAPHDAAALAGRDDLEDTAGDGDAGEGGVLSQVGIVLHLRSLDLFAGLTTRQLSEIAAVVHEEVFPAGTSIVREGEFGDCMYLIVAGEVRITRAGQYEVAAGVGDLFGEMSLFDGETRLASVVAVRRVRLLRLDRHDLFELMEEQPAIAIGICQTLSRHARDSILRTEKRRSET